MEEVTQVPSLTGVAGMKKGRKGIFTHCEIIPNTNNLGNSRYIL
jgi:hypothetical protein